MKLIILLITTFVCIALKAQSLGPVLALNSTTNKASVSEVKRLKGSESAEFSFLVESNIKENQLFIKTNFEGKYKVRFIEYYGSTVKVVKNISANKVIDISEFKNEIFIMNISDATTHKLLSSQVLNLKRRN